MSHHYLRQIEKLKRVMLALGELVGRGVEEAIEAIHRRDDQRAMQVIAREAQIDMLEVDLEEECLHTLALYQPVASDLRFVVALVTINKDLERMGDLAVDLAEQALHFARKGNDQAIPFDLVGESRRVREMLRLALDALVNIDADLAERVRQSDDAVDRIHAQACDQIEAAIQENPADTARLLRLLNVTRQLERIADHTVNIAEDVIYMARGEFLRHRALHHASPEMAVMS